MFFISNSYLSFFYFFYIKLVWKFHFCLRKSFCSRPLPPLSVKRRLSASFLPSWCFPHFPHPLSFSMYCLSLCLRFSPVPSCLPDYHTCASSTNQPLLHKTAAQPSSSARLFALPRGNGGTVYVCVLFCKPCSSEIFGTFLTNCVFCFFPVL